MTMNSTRNVAVLVGSLRAGSHSRKLAQALAAFAPASLALDIVEIRDLPFYDEDADGEHPPASWTAFRDRIRAADAVLFVTPEYNRSVPAVLKNAIDVGSRPYGQSVWAGKPGAVLSTSIGPLGGFGANHHLRQSLAHLDVPTMGQPEAYVGNTGALFDAEGRLSDARVERLLRRFVETYARWIEQVLAAPDRAPGR